ncbi:hypothetical protein M9Y10_026596 [Tritrichomonas musculus]|uniref:Uncharacterized protein n=1 Tax=Tritrichomonas musculus TaxID=1915356 RepID=A0ABR2H736_9EUKA
MAGTLRCMAPEIIQEKTNYNEKVDVYSAVLSSQFSTRDSFQKLRSQKLSLAKRLRFKTTYQSSQKTSLTSAGPSMLTIGHHSQKIAKC